MIKAIVVSNHFARAAIQAEIQNYMEAIAGSNDALLLLYQSRRRTISPDHPFNAALNEAINLAVDGHNMRAVERKELRVEWEVREPCHRLENQ